MAEIRGAVERRARGANAFIYKPKKPDWAAEPLTTFRSEERFEIPRYGALRRIDAAGVETELGCFPGYEHHTECAPGEDQNDEEAFEGAMHNRRF